MEVEEITKHNQQIANFMGVSMIGTRTKFEYNDSWDWLMPVVEKIEKEFEPISICIYKEATEFKVWDEGFFKYRKISYDAVSKIGHVYCAVIEFLKWKQENNT